jgi:hypothetical protein
MSTYNTGVDPPPEFSRIGIPEFLSTVFKGFRQNQRERCPNHSFRAQNYILVIFKMQTIVSDIFRKKKVVSMQHLQYKSKCNSVKSADTLCLLDKPFKRLHTKILKKSSWRNLKSAAQHQNDRASVQTKVKSVAKEGLFKYIVSSK